MKITYAITKGNWGGAQKYVFDLATAMKERGHEVSIVFGEPGKLEDLCKEAGIPTRTIPHLQRDISILKEISSFFRLIKILGEDKPDVLHLNSTKMGGLGSIAAQILNFQFSILHFLKIINYKLKIKVVYTAHGWSFNEDRSPLSRLIHKIASWATIIFSTKVIVLSEHEKMQVIHWPGAKNKILVVPIGIKEIDFLTKKEARQLLEDSLWKAFPRRLQLGKESPAAIGAETIWIGNIAELHKNKGLEYAIQAVSRLPLNLKYVFMIIGVGEEEKKLQTLIEKLELKKKVFLLGFQKSAARFLKAFDIFLFSSIKEGLPYALLEAGAAGLPVVSTEVGSISDIITDHHSGLLCHPKNPSALKEALEVLLSSPNDRTEYGQNLKAKIMAQFTFEKMVKMTLSCYGI